MESQRRRSVGRQEGFNLTELMVVVAIIGLLAAVSVPFFLSYLQAATLKTGAEEIAAFLNQGRQLAITNNQNVCVNITSTTMRYRIGGCAGTTWVGTGTDASGNVNMPAGVTLTTSADPVFSYLGTATPAATYTVTNPRDGKTLTVSVAASGRVRIGP
jgi:type II secretion system protein H